MCVIVWGVSCEKAELLKMRGLVFSSVFKYYEVNSGIGRHQQSAKEFILQFRGTAGSRTPLDYFTGFIHELGLSDRLR